MRNYVRLFDGLWNIATDMITADTIFVASSHSDFSGLFWGGITNTERKSRSSADCERPVET